MRRLLKITLLCILAVPVVAFVMYWSYEWSDASAQREQYAVYSAYLSDNLLTNDHDYGDGKGILVILDHSMRPRTSHQFPQVSTRMTLDLGLHNLRSVHFDRKFSLPTPYKLVSSDRIEPGTGTLVELSHDERMKSLGGYVTLSRISFNRTTTLALFYTEHLACSLCGGGDLVLMQKQQGRWKVIDDYSPWVS